MESNPKPQPLSKPESRLMDSPQPTPSSPPTPTQYQVRLANPSDAQWLIDLSNHVQSALTSTGSLQELTPSTLETILAAITKQEIYVLISTSTPKCSSLNYPGPTTSSSECPPASATRLGSVTISPFSPPDGRGNSAWPISILTSISTTTKTTSPTNQNHNSHYKTWYLNSLMLHPSHQGQGLGKSFLQEVFQLLGMTEGMGMVVLDCWAGNEKLRSFYEGVGFSLVAVFPEREYEIAVFEVGVGGGC